LSNQPQPPGKFIFILIIVWAIVLTSCFVNRPGVLRLIDEAIAAPDIAVGICSAATKAGFLKVVNSIVGPERLSRLDVIMAGDSQEARPVDLQLGSRKSQLAELQVRGHRGLARGAPGGDGRGHAVRHHAVPVLGRPGF
jgi:hypothetical protein